MQNNIYEDYAVVEAQIKVLKNKQDEMRVEILKEMVEKDQKTIKTAVGSFSVSQRKSWEYTKNVEEAKEKLDALKAKEESCGDATFIETPSLMFRTIKL